MKLHDPFQSYLVTLEKLQSLIHPTNNLQILIEKIKEENLLAKQIIALEKNIKKKMKNY